ncbi:MAG: hypothetical protein ACRDSF_13485 [Pseudonocardiaceae bacterium]
MDYALHVSGLPLTSAELGGFLVLPALRIPDPQFPTKTPAGRRSSCPAPSYGAHLHPLLRRLPVAGGCGAGGTS